MVEEQNTDIEEIDILAYIHLFLQKWYWIALSCIICGIIAFLVNRYATKEFTADASIMIKEQEDAMGSMATILKEISPMGGKTNIDNQIGFLQSYSLIRKNLEKLNYQVSYYNHGRVHDVEIYKNSPFIVDLDTSYYNYNTKNYKPEIINVEIVSDDEYILSIDRDSIKVTKTMVWGEQYSDTLYRFTLRKNENFDMDNINEKRRSEYRFIVNNYNTLTKLYQKNLIVEASTKKGTIVNLSIKDNVPEKAIDFLNGLIDTRIAQDLEDKNETSKKSEDFINAQLKEITDSLTFAEMTLEEFRSNNKIVNLSDEGSLLYKKLEQQESEKSKLGIKLNYYNYLLRSLKTNNIEEIRMPSITGIDDPLLTSLISQLNKLYTDKQVLAYSATPDNPNLQIINMKIEQTVSSLIDNVNSLIESTKLEMNEIKKEIAKTDTSIQQLPGTERELINIQRNFDVNNSVYSFLLQKRAEIGLTKAANISDIKILDEARIENAIQSFPKLKLLLLAALLLGIILPCGIILLINQLDRTIKDRSDIENNTKVPIIGSISHNRHEDKIPVKTVPKSPIAESFRAIRSNLPFFLKNKTTNEPNIIALTSTLSGEGKSFCAMNISAILSMVNKKVLLIGLDLRKPRLAEMMNMPNTIGVTTHLIGRDSLDDIIIKTDITNLDVIVAGPIPPNPGELIESPEFDAFINNCKQRDYDYIILDTPPIGLVADTIAIAKFANCNIFVMRQNYTTRDSINLVNSIAKEQISNLCILINDVKTNGSYGYGYGYGYGAYDDKNKHGYYTDEDIEKTPWYKRIFNKD